jgi:outer membrane immunogenic protein
MRLIAVAIATSMFAAPALAADMALKAPPPPPVATLNWTGLYIGANAGGGWSHTDWQDNHFAACSGVAFALAGCDIPQNLSSFVGGGQIGARWQTGQWVLGVEGTADYANFNSTIVDPAAGLGINDTTKLQGLYTATVQAGITWDRELWYVKGGWAGSRLTRNTLTTSGTEGGPVSQQANGWTVGTGLEYRLTSWPNFSVGLEYDYIHLGASNVATCVRETAGGASAFCGGGVGGTQPLLYNGFHASVNEVLARANYSFNWGGR